MATATPGTDTALETLAINTIRTLSIDAIQQANSGHPGLPLGAAPMAYVLWTQFLRHNPRNPKWPNRDRFVFSPGHGSMLLYSLLHLTGYDLSLDDLRQFRQWGSKTPGHPEYPLTPGVELTTGPLGQGFANGIGLAIAEAHLAATYNRPGHTIVDHHTYGIVSDGDLMEGVAYEAASLAGHLRLGKLVYLYDRNDITLAGSANLSFTEDVGKRFEACGWYVRHVEDGNDTTQIASAFTAGQAELDRPTLVIVHTTIGYGSPEKQGTFEVHGSPLGGDELLATKRALGWPSEEPFFVPTEVREHFGQAVEHGAALERDWQERFERYRAEYPELAQQFEQALSGRLPGGWVDGLPRFEPGEGKLATRSAGGKVINAIASTVPWLIGGSADLNPSTNTALKGLGDFQSPQTPLDPERAQGAVGGPWGYAGRNVHFGVREHAMGAIANGMAYHGGVQPFTATFLVFSDYMRPAMRLAAISELPTIFVFTHDSIGLGEDGPTHQPIEHLAALRAIPNMTVIRPADANETAAAWRAAMENRHGPTTLVFSRQALPILDQSRVDSAQGLPRGGYVVRGAEGGQPDLILLATGSELWQALDAADILANEGRRVRVVSLPSWELFQAQPQAYRDQVLPPRVRARVAVEAAVPLGWERWVGDSGDVVGLTRFGASAPSTSLYEHLGFTAQAVAERARAVLARIESDEAPHAGEPEGTRSTNRATFSKAEGASA